MIEWSTKVLPFSIRVHLSFHTRDFNSYPSSMFFGSYQQEDLGFQCTFRCSIGCILNNQNVLLFWQTVLFKISINKISFHFWCTPKKLYVIPGGYHSRVYSPLNSRKNTYGCHELLKSGFQLFTKEINTESFRSYFTYVVAFIKPLQ